MLAWFGDAFKGRVDQHPRMAASALAGKQVEQLAEAMSKQRKGNPVVSPVDLISRHLRDPQTSWAIGTFGAIAEFHRDADEPVALSTHGAVTARGGIRLQLDGAVRPIAWERPAAGDGWMHGIALCLSATSGAMNGRSTVTELGPDIGALKEEDRDAVLFDLGIGAPHCDICVRTSDSGIQCSLRAAIGQPVLDTELLCQIPDMSPTRVFISRLGRVEVRTPIPKPDGRTPDGRTPTCCRICSGIGVRIQRMWRCPSAWFRSRRSFRQARSMTNMENGCASMSSGTKRFSLCLPCMPTRRAAKPRRIPSPRCALPSPRATCRPIRAPSGLRAGSRSGNWRRPTDRRPR